MDARVPIYSEMREILQEINKTSLRIEGFGRRSTRL
jgi:hypothetical protein